MVTIPGITDQARTDPLNRLMTLAFGAGAVVHATSLLLSLATYSRGGIVLGLRSADLERLLQNTPPTRDYLRAAIAAYVDGIRRYQEINHTMNRDLSLARQAFTVGLILGFLGTGIFIILAVGGSF